MIIRCLKKDLASSINIVQKAVSTKSNMAIMECILVDASAGVIKLTGNDTELGIETVLEGGIEERGMVALDARLFADIVRKLPDGEVLITCDENLVTTFKSLGTKIRIMGKDAADFTHIPMIEKDEPVVLSQFALRQIIQQTIFSIAANDSNKLMTGEYFEVNGASLRLSALDGHRISLRNLSLKSAGREIKAIVPGKTLSEVARILSGGPEDMVHVYFTQNHVMFVFDETVVVSRLIEGNYFRVDQMISTDYETKVTVNRREFLECLDRSTLMVKEDDRRPIVLDITEGMMQLQISSQIGSTDDRIPVIREGKDIRIGFNPRFLMDALKVIEDEEVSLFFINAKSPCFIRDEEKSFIYLVLPINFV